MEFQWDPLDFVYEGKSKVVVYLGEIQEIPSKVLLTFWGGVINPNLALFGGPGYRLKP